MLSRNQMYFPSFYGSPWGFQVLVCFSSHPPKLLKNKNLISVCPLSPGSEMGLHQYLLCFPLIEAEMKDVSRRKEIISGCGGNEVGWIEFVETGLTRHSKAPHGVLWRGRGQSTMTSPLGKQIKKQDCACSSTCEFGSLWTGRCFVLERRPEPPV